MDVNVNAKSFTSFGLLDFVFRTSSSVSVCMFIFEFPFSHVRTRTPIPISISVFVFPFPPGPRPYAMRGTETAGREGNVRLFFSNVFHIHVAHVHTAYSNIEYRISPPTRVPAFLSSKFLSIPPSFRARASSYTVKIRIKKLPLRVSYTAAY